MPQYSRCESRNTSTQSHYTDTSEQCAITDRSRLLSRRQLQSTASSQASSSPPPPPPNSLSSSSSSFMSSTIATFAGKMSNNRLDLPQRSTLFNSQAMISTKLVYITVIVLVAILFSVNISRYHTMMRITDDLANQSIPLSALSLSSSSSSSSSFQSHHRNISSSRASSKLHSSYLSGGVNHNSSHAILYNNATTVPSTNVDAFSACLLIRDDNHFLVEWMLYHYHVLPLRYLIVMVDPQSQTSPSKILDRYRKQLSPTEQQHEQYQQQQHQSSPPSSSNVLHHMEIIEWTSDRDYETPAELAKAKRLVREYFGAHIGEELIVHRARQRMFYYRCLLHHQRHNRTWVALIDTDEFLRINYRTAATVPWMTMNQSNAATGATTSASSTTMPTTRVPPIQEPGSVMKLLQQLMLLPSGIQNYTSSPCIQIPRSRFGSSDSPRHLVERAVPASLRALPHWNTDMMLSMRYRRHAAADDYLVNRISKAIVDVSRLTSSSTGDVDDETVDLQPVTSIHRPIRRYCTQRGLHVRAHQQLFLVHHYLGSYEQYQYRDDPRNQQPKLRGKEVHGIKQ
jgi:hypothetical protein